MAVVSCDNIQPTVATQQNQLHACHRILVADDESAVRAFMSSVLLHAGYRVDVAQDGAVAWAALQAEPYDLLITDYNMPRINGVELVRNLRAAESDATLKPPESTTATTAPVDNEINKSSGSLLVLAALVLVVAAQHPR